MKTIEQWLSEYGESHKNETNKTIHWICVPAIFFSITGFFYSIKLPVSISGFQMNVALVLMVMVIIYYALLSRTIWFGMMIFVVICLLLCHLLENWGVFPLWATCLGIFVLAWIGQFYGHKVEGRKPSFFKDIQFLMIGPAWLMSFIYKKMNIGL